MLLDNIPLNSSYPVQIVKDTFVVAVQAIAGFNITGQTVALDASNSYDESSGLLFNVNVSQPTAAIYLPPELFSEPSIANSTSLTHAVFLTDSLFIRRQESSLNVTSTILSSSLVGATVAGLYPPIALTFSINQVRPKCVWYSLLLSATPSIDRRDQSFILRVLGQFP